MGLLWRVNVVLSVQEVARDICVFNKIDVWEIIFFLFFFFFNLYKITMLYNQKAHTHGFTN